MEPTMTLKRLFIAMPAALFIMAHGPANAGQTTNEAGAIACVTDKWDEKEVEKGHKLVDAVQRCILIPNDPAEPKFAEDCVGKYEYMPDESWKGSGTCTDNYKGGDTKTETWEEGSHLKEYTYKITGGTGKYQGASGSGTYIYENLTDTLSGGTYKGTMQLP
jgi:hypothetical protein